MNDHANTAADNGPNSTVDIFRPDAVHDSAVDDPCNLRPDNTTDSMCYAVEVCNRFSSLPIENPQVMTSSAEELPEIEKRRSQGGSDYSSDKLELAAEMMMHRFSSQKVDLAVSGKNQGGRCTSTEVHSSNSGGNSLTSNGSSGTTPQTHNQKVAQEQTLSQQSIVDKSPSPNAGTSTTNSQTPVQKRDNTPNDNATSLDDVFMPKDDAINSSDDEFEEIDRELEEFKKFCLLTKPLENCPKITLPFRPNIRSKTEISYFDTDFTREAPQLIPPDTHDPIAGKGQGVHLQDITFAKKKGEHLQ